MMKGPAGMIEDLRVEKAEVVISAEMTGPAGLEGIVIRSAMIGMNGHVLPGSRLLSCLLR
jgi:hypothetical protein